MSVQAQRLSFLVLDTSGNAVSGATVKVRRQGGTLDGGMAASASAVVHDPGAVHVNDTVYFETDEVTAFNVNGLSADGLTITLNTTTTQSDGARLRIGIGEEGTASEVQLLYTDVTLSDPVGGGSPTNDLTTDATGRAAAWAGGGKFDALVSEAGITTFLLTDVGTEGDLTVITGVSDGSYVGKEWDTLRPITADTAVMYQWKIDGTFYEKMQYTNATTTWDKTLRGRLHVQSTAGSEGALYVGDSSPTFGAAGTIITTSDIVSGGTVRVSADGSGASSTVTLTNDTAQTLSTGSGTVLMGGSTDRNSTGWLKIYDGTTAKYIPFWTTVTG